VKDLDLDHLEDDQKAALEAAKKTLPAALEAAGVERDLHDLEVLRFLSCRHYNVDEAVTAFVDMVKWRIEAKVDSVMDSLPPKYDDICLLMPHQYPGVDKAGRPVYIERTGYTRIGELNQIASVDEMLRVHIYGMELMDRKMKASSAKLGKEVDTFVTLLDLENLSLAVTSAIPLLRAVTDLDYKYYPDRVERVFIINAPWIMPTVWASIQYFLPETLKARIQILGTDYKEILAQHFDAENLPEEYGGTAPPIKLPTDEDAKSILNRDASGLSLDEHHVAAGQALEKKFKLSAGDTIVWSFKVTGDYDVGFSCSMQDGHEPAADAPVTSLKPESRIITHKGEYTVDKDVTVTLKWDNSFSYWNGKDLKYHASVRKA
jgi:CRAL/TRIO domain